MSDIYIQVKKGGGGMATGPLPPASPQTGDVWSPHPEVSFVAIRTGTTTDEAAYSYDGIAWQATTLPFSDNWSTVEYFNGMFIAVPANQSENDQIAYSWDGITWNTQTILPSYVAQSGARTVLLKGAGGIAFTFTPSIYSDPLNLFFSRDGLSWENAGRSPDSNARNPVVSFGENGRFILNDSSSTRIQFIISRDTELAYGSRDGALSNRGINNYSIGIDGYIFTKDSNRGLRFGRDTNSAWGYDSSFWSAGGVSHACCPAYPNGVPTAYFFGSDNIVQYVNTSTFTGLTTVLPNSATIRGAAFGVDKVVATEQNSRNTYYSNAAGDSFTLATDAMPVAGQWEITGRMVDRAETPRVFDGTDWIIPQAFS